MEKELTSVRNQITRLDERAPGRQVDKRSRHVSAEMSESERESEKSVSGRRHQQVRATGLSLWEIKRDCETSVSRPTIITQGR